MDRDNSSGISGLSRLCQARTPSSLRMSDMWSTAQLVQYPSRPPEENLLPIWCRTGVTEAIESMDIVLFARRRLGKSSTGVKPSLSLPEPANDSASLSAGIIGAAIVANAGVKANESACETVVAAVLPSIILTSESPRILLSVEEGTRKILFGLVVEHGPIPLSSARCETLAADVMSHFPTAGAAGGAFALGGPLCDSR